jgi:hypothetical protein
MRFVGGNRAVVIKELRQPDAEEEVLGLSLDFFLKWNYIIIGWNGLPAVLDASLRPQKGEGNRSRPQIVQCRSADRTRT